MPNTFNSDGSPEKSARQQDFDYLKDSGPMERGGGANRRNYREGIQMDVENVRTNAKIMRGGKEPDTRTDAGLVDVMKANREKDDMDRRESRGLGK